MKKNSYTVTYIRYTTHAQGHNQSTIWGARGWTLIHGVLPDEFLLKSVVIKVSEEITKAEHKYMNAYPLTL